MKSIALVSVSLVLALSACGSGDADSSSTDVVAAAAGGESTDATGTTDDSMSSSSDPQSTTTTTTLVAARNTLAGEWRASAADILSANLANLGGMPMTCIGEIVMNLNDDGSFARGGSMVCSIDGVKILGQFVNSSGTWEATSDTITVTVTSNDGYAESFAGGGAPTRMALPDGGYSSAEYEVTATTLTVTFTEPSVGTVTQVYTRA